MPPLVHLAVPLRPDPPTHAQKEERRRQARAQELQGGIIDPVTRGLVEYEVTRACCLPGGCTPTRALQRAYPPLAGALTQARYAPRQDDDDLNARIDAVYMRLNKNDQDGLTFHEFRNGLKKMDIHLTQDDWEILTDHGKLTDESDMFDMLQFRIIMKGELWVRLVTTRRGTEGGACWV